MTRIQRIRILLPIVAVAGVVSWLLFNRAGTDGLTTASGTVEATEANLGFELAGRIDSVAVREGDRVAAGALIARLDGRQLDAERRAAAAQVGVAEARLEELRAGFRSEEIGQARATLERAERQVVTATSDLERSRRLFEGGAISREQFEHAEAAYDVARADRDRAREALQLLERGPRPEDISAARAGLRQARATVDRLDARLANTDIVAPFPGVVTNRHREPGEIVAPGAPVVTLMNPDDRWVRIYVREDEVGGLSLGQPVTIRADADPDHRYGGEITYISDRAEFTPRNVQTTAERVRLVYEVRVRITDDPSFDLKPGLAADVSIEPEP